MPVSPWAVGLEPGDRVWVTVIEVGAPTWKKGSVIDPVNTKSLRARIALEDDGREIVAHQHDIRSFSYLRTRTS